MSGWFTDEAAAPLFLRRNFDSRRKLNADVDLSLLHPRMIRDKIQLVKIYIFHNLNIRNK